MFAVLRKEINSFLNSMIAYIVIGVFLLATGLFMWVFPDSSVLDYGYADMYTLFNIAPWMFLFLIPAITMRTFAEEKKSGTIELLLTKPITDFDLILGKFLACLSLAVLALLPTLIYYYSVYTLGNPVGNIDSAAVAGSYLGMFFLAGIFTAIGVFASALTENQIVAFIVAVFFCFLVYAGFDSLATIDVWGTTSYLISQLGVSFHYNTLSKGLIDSRDVLYFVSVAALFLLATKLIMESWKW
ncbi:gliding motility-associated ABC transporter permease subunit GldF [Adhaeribacter radiodurans]|uniref:Gliding motility-associated ABC transporter permease subunit GldF n=1 Tax=Adhaeribacter radiodurans TaxID=2745197 RepID=A0A7L7L8C8_9BACT|nr:gliding motility-associated ABC transporter permease subunit GldF [Adhaeribacter radiodurans]QMU29003.1 gliding motility-associated ABC transporter permease subunit GldF [Adhaeribacter radiodurans]